MIDRVLTAFLERQQEEGMALAAASDILDLVPLGGEPPRMYLARFDCAGLVQTQASEIVTTHRFVAAIWLQEDHLQRVDTASLVTLLEPRDPAIFHPNARGPFVCLGRIGAGITLVDVCYQLYEIFTYGRFRLNDVLNADAATWARRNLHRFPLERRSLKRRPDTMAGVAAGDFDIEVVEVSA